MLRDSEVPRNREIKLLAGWRMHCMRGVMRMLWFGALTLVAACGSGPASAAHPSAPTPVAEIPVPLPAPSPTPAPSGSTVVRLNDDFGGRRPFPDDNWWNQDISSAPIDGQSNALIDAIGRTRGLHPDFGPPPYGIPYVGVGGAEPRAPVVFVDYGNESDTVSAQKLATRFRTRPGRSPTTSRAAGPAAAAMATDT